MENGTNFYWAPRVQFWLGMLITCWFVLSGCLWIKNNKNFVFWNAFGPLNLSPKWPPWPCFCSAPRCHFWPVFFSNPHLAHLWTILLDFCWFRYPLVLFSCMCLCLPLSAYFLAYFVSQTCPFAHCAAAHQFTTLSMVLVLGLCSCYWIVVMSWIMVACDGVYEFLFRLWLMCSSS